MTRTATLKATVLGAALSGLVVMGAGAAPADPTTTKPGGGSGVAVSAAGTGSDYGRGTTRSDNSPGNAGGLS